MLGKLHFPLALGDKPGIGPISFRDLRIELTVSVGIPQTLAACFILVVQGSHYPRQPVGGHRLVYIAGGIQNGDGLLDLTLH